MLLQLSRGNIINAKPHSKVLLNDDSWTENKLHKYSKKNTNEISITINIWYWLHMKERVAWAIPIPRWESWVQFAIKVQKATYQILEIQTSKIVFVKQIIQFLLYNWHAKRGIEKWQNHWYSISVWLWNIWTYYFKIF